MKYRYRYIITDSQNCPLARAFLETHPNQTTWRIRVLDGDIGRVMEHEIVNLIGMNQDNPAMTGRILSQEGEDVVTLKPVDPLDEDMRRSLRVPVRFDSFLYPITGSWEGRIPVVCHAISCGGIAFFCAYPLKIAEVAEIVVPITTQPLILQVRVLRLRPSASPISLYSAKFVNIINDEEVMVREAVFCQQIRNRDARK